MATVNAPFVEKASSSMKDLWSAFSSSEARYFDEERFSEAEIRKSLNDNLTDRKIDAMKRILAAVSVGRDASALFPDVVKNISFQSLELKKLIYIYLVQYSENNCDSALLSINSFQKDLSDRSALVRASALRAMASINVIEVIQLVMVAVKSASSDMSAYVRKTASQCITKVYAVDPDQFFELRGLLLRLLNDHEVQVVGSAIMAYHQICIVQPPRTPVDAAADGGSADPDENVRSQLELLHPHFRRLCRDILTMDAWAQQSGIDVLLRYCRLFFAGSSSSSSTDDPARGEDSGSGGPSAEGAVEAKAVSPDLTSFLRTLKLLLSSSSKGVTLAAAAAFCYLAPSEELALVTQPLLRCLRQAPAESVHAMLVALMPIVETKPSLLRPSIREFFVLSFDFPLVKELKLRILENLVDETNVQMVLRELQAYICWQSFPDFVTLAVQSIAHVALKISSVTDSCLRGLVKMLDSKCEALACEAVVALRALLQRRQQNMDSGLGTVLPHLVRYLEDLSAPTARASVVWIIGQYQSEAPKLAPDVIRKLAKTFPTERQEVKQQILGLSLKVWAFHALNAWGEISIWQQQGAGDGAVAEPGLPREESAQILARLEALADHIMVMASYDTAWDVRDTARALQQVKNAGKAAMNTHTISSPPQSCSFEDLGLCACRANISGKSPAEAGEGPGASERDGEGVKRDTFESTWSLGSLAQALDFPLETYRPLPAWNQVNTPDEIRSVKVEATPAIHTAPKSISSSNVGNIQHMESRTQNPSNISSMPVVSTLEDLNLFYDDTSTTGPAAKASGSTGPRTEQPATEPVTLEQMRIANNSGAPVGTAVFGEDSESDEEEDEQDDDDDAWKYCMQAAPKPEESKADEAAPADVAQKEGADQQPAESTFQPPPRVEASSEPSPDLSADDAAS